MSVSLRYFAQSCLKASITEVAGVIGYQAATVHSGIEAPESGRGVAVDEDAVLGGIHLLEANRKRALEVVDRKVVAELDGFAVRLHEGRLALELLFAGSSR